MYICGLSSYSLLSVYVAILTPLLHLITALLYVLKSGSVCPPTVCFVNYVFTILDSLDCHINSRISLSSSSNQTSQDFDKACTASVDQYTENWYLNNTVYSNPQRWYMYDFIKILFELSIFGNFCVCRNLTSLSSSVSHSVVSNSLRPHRL